MKLPKKMQRVADKAFSGTKKKTAPKTKSKTKKRRG